MDKDQKQNTSGTLRSQGECGVHLRRACRELIAAVGDLEAGERFCRVRKTQLGRYQSNGADFMPIDVVLDLETTAAAPLVTKALAQKAGYELTRLPSLEAKGIIAEQLLKVFKESSEVITAGADALRDNTICDADARTLHKETCEAISALVHLRLLIEQRRPRLLPQDSKEVLAS